MLKKIVALLDRELAIRAFADDSHNGLQVENAGKITRVCCGVDASLEFFAAAVKRKADLVVCHHGLSWGGSLARITGLNYRRLKLLLDNGVALYACHLPLDAHPRYGNNAQICQAFGLRQLKPFGLYRGIPIGFSGSLPKAVSYTVFKERVRRVFGNTVGSMDFGRRAVRTIAVVSGGAAAEIEEAGQKGLDVFISGEPSLMAYHLAQEYGINAIFAGHYATEVFGVKALARLLASRFRLQTEFLDMGIRL